MSEYILCSNGLHISLRDGHGQILLQVMNGDGVSFTVDDDVLGEVLDGDPVQLSAEGGYVKLERRGDRVYFDISLATEGLKRCECTVEAFEGAIGSITTQRPDGDFPCVK